MGSMCGIAGVVAPEAQRFDPVVRSMLAALGHRGPDGSSVVSFDRCVLGAVRLAIVDLAHGDQPMCRPDGGAAVAFNGEIYGHRRIRSALASYPFRTSCDTEVLLALHQREGGSFAEYLPGMFAYGLWDEARGQLECGRDRFGEKPLFWMWGPDGEFVFASEIKGLLATGWVDGVVDDAALAHYLRHGYVHPLTTIYRDIHPLPPAHRLTFDGAQTRQERYWAPPPVQDGVGMAEAAEQLTGLLRTAVTDQLEADVPVGAFLSGGVDSSSVVALAAERHDQIHTFSFGFGGADDETEYASRQARFSGTTHHSFDATDIDIPALLRELPAVYDEPFGDSSAVPTLLLSRATRRHVKVALTGDGADELLGGYLFWARRYLAQTGVRLPAVLGGPGPSRLPLRRNALARAYVGFRSYVGAPELQALGLAPDDQAERAASRHASGQLADVLRVDLEGYLPGDILVKTDRASMSAGLELRSPFLDRDVAEFCLSLPDELKVDDRQEKLVLRRALEATWDPSVRTREKQGFGGPFATWLGGPEVAGLVADTLGRPSSRVFDLVDPAGVQPLAAGTGQATWNLLMLALWAEVHPRARR
jgi:asparagine synthase (glutamine-hydrolysing)